VLHDGRAVGVEDDDVAGADRRAPHLDRHVELARRLLLRAAHAHVARPDRQPELDELLEVAHRRVDEDRRGPVDLGLGGQQVANEGHGGGLGHRQHEHLAGLQRGHRRVDHEVVVLGAARDARRPRDARTGHDLVQGRVDEAAPAAALVNGRRAQPRQLGAVAVAHSSLTTWGITRWKASAYSTDLSPEARRAWLARCSARWA
jgi:hypothetical protein